MFPNCFTNLNKVWLYKYEYLAGSIVPLSSLEFPIRGYFIRADTVMRTKCDNLSMKQRLCRWLTRFRNIDIDSQNFQLMYKQIIYIYLFIYVYIYICYCRKMSCPSVSVHMEYIPCNICHSGYRNIGVGLLFRFSCGYIISSQWSPETPADPWRNDNVIITSKRRCYVILT